MHALFTCGKRNFATLAGVLLALCGGGCAQIVVLGTDCPDADGPCIMALEQPDAADAPADTGVRTQETLDAGVTRASDAGPQPRTDAAAQPDSAFSGVSLGLRNPEFQRNQGVPAGDVVLSKALSDGLDLIALSVVISDLPNWFACWVGSVNAVSWDLDQDVGTPLYQGDYLSLVLNAALLNPGKIEPARQDLSTPMQVGVTYAMQMDVLGLPDNGSQLYMEIRGHSGDCTSTGSMLARVEIPPERRWTTLCLEFTPQQAFTQFLISAGYTGPQPSPAARVRLDSLRQVSACPAQR